MLINNFKENLRSNEYWHTLMEYSDQHNQNLERFMNTSSKFKVGKTKRLISELYTDQQIIEMLDNTLLNYETNTTPDDFVISTGKNYSIEDFIKKVFKLLDLDWKKFVTTNNKNFLRPAEVRSLQGDSSKARKLLKWKPEYDLDALCKDMLLNDLKLYGMTLEQAKKIAQKLSKK